MRIGTSYKQHGIEGQYDTIVIGSGIGGLACAAMLAKHGRQKVLVLERHYTAGGFTHTFHRPGYEWDVGVHYIGQTHPKALLRRAFDEISEGELQWADMGSIYDTIVIGEDRYPLPAGRRNWLQAMAGFFPDEKPALGKYLDLIAQAAKASQLFFAEKVVPGPISAVAGGAMRYRMMKLGRRTTLDVLSELTQNQRLRAVLTGQYGDYGLPPAQSSFFMHALVVNHYLGGGAYPVGGSAQIAATILPVIERAGGKVVTSAEVDQIIIDKDTARGVRLADGSEHFANAVVSDAGVMNTLNRLVDEDTTKRHGFEKTVSKTAPSVAHASLYLGFKQTAAELGLAKGNLWVYPHDDHDKSFRDFLRDEDAPLPLAYVSFPSAKDPDFNRRYPGRATVEVVSLAPWNRFAEWSGTRWKKRGEGYEAAKQNLSERMLAALYKECPQLEGAIDHCELSTPLSTAHFSNFSTGEIYGIAHTPERFAQRWLRPKTPVRGLFLTGSDICTAGVGGALFGGLLTVSAMLGKNMVNVVAARAPVV